MTRVSSALPTSGAAVVDSFAEWLYLAPSERLKMGDSRLSKRLCVTQLMALFMRSELHCVHGGAEPERQALC